MSAHETLKQKAYAIIQNKLLEGELRAGDALSELNLAQQIGMSRTPIREAIGQLEIEGLFDKVPRSGTIVRLAGKSELRELYEVREALEGHAATVAATKLQAADLAAMERLQQELIALVAEMRARELSVLDEPLLRRFFASDISFHDTIVRAPGNGRVLKIINEFRVVQRVFEYDRMSYTAQLVESAAREHGEILRALTSSHAEAARAAMALHIRASRDHAMEAFRQNGGERRPVARRSRTSVAD